MTKSSCWVEVGEPGYSGCDVDEEGDDDGDDDRVDDGDADVNIRGDSDDGCHGVCSSSSRPVAKIETNLILDTCTEIHDPVFRVNWSAFFGL